MALSPSGLKADSVKDIIAKQAEANQIPTKLGIAIATVESGLNQKAVGSKGEIGLFQVMPYHYKRTALYNPEINARVAMKLLKEYRVQCADMGEYWIICYNQGPTRRPKYPQLHPYYKRVMEAMK